MSKLKKIIMENEKDLNMATPIILPTLLSMKGKQRPLVSPLVSFAVPIGLLIRTLQFYQVCKMFTNGCIAIVIKNIFLSDQEWAGKGLAIFVYKFCQYLSALLA